MALVQKVAHAQDDYGTYAQAFPRTRCGTIFMLKSFGNRKERLLGIELVQKVAHAQENPVSYAQAFSSMRRGTIFMLWSSWKSSLQAYGILNMKRSKLKG